MTYTQAVVLFSFVAGLIGGFGLAVAFLAGCVRCALEDALPELEVEAHTEEQFQAFVHGARVVLTPARRRLRAVTGKAS